MARPKKPTALLKLQGTYRADQNGENRPDEVLSEIIDLANQQIEPPASIKDEYCRQFYSSQIKMLQQLNLLSVNDLPELENLTFILQQMRAIQKQLQKTKPDQIEAFGKLSKIFQNYTRLFSTIAQKYYISPTARMRINLDALNLAKGERQLSPLEQVMGTKE